METGLLREYDQDLEEDILFFDEVDIREGVEECSKSLIGRMLADRSFSSGTMEVALGAIWGHLEGFRVLDHGDNVFQMFFAKEVDVLRVERGTPWLFKNFILNLWRWRDDMRIKEEDFSHVPIWVQLWGMPEHYKTVELGWKIREKIGGVDEVALFIVKGKESRIIKVKVKLDVTKVLRDRVKIAGLNKKVIEIMLKYERLGCFCHYCGHIGHETRSCTELLEDTAKGEIKDEKIGPWLKADQVGRRVEDNKENADPNNKKEGFMNTE